MIMKTEYGTKWARLRVSNHIEIVLLVESGGSLNEKKVPGQHEQSHPIWYTFGCRKKYEALDENVHH